MRKYPFVQLDVFSDTRLEGNQLAVFTDANGLSSEEMQALARETNLSETTFVLRRDAATEQRDGFHVRIFTVEEELPFAGHPTLGTAYYLHKQTGQTTVELDLKVGKVPVTFTTSEGKLRGEMRQRDPEFGQIHDREAVAAAIGLPLSALEDSVPVQTVSTGMGFAMVAIRELQDLQTIRFNWVRAAEYLEQTDAKFFYLVCRETVNPDATLHARMIFYNGEDPATGSAAGCCTAWAVQHGVFPSEQMCLIEQGLEMKRPSHIYVRATKVANGVTNVRVGGSVVQTMQGEVFLD